MRPLPHSLNADPADASTEAAPPTTPAEPQAQRPAPRPTSRPDAKPLPPHAVILHNDPINGFDFVIASLMKVFRYDMLRAFKLTTAAHLKGRSVVWSGHKELAELKAQQLTSRGADPVMKAKGAKPLRVTVEPLPG